MQYGRYIDQNVKNCTFQSLCESHCTYKMKALKCKTLGASVMYIVITHTYADKCVSVRGSIRKFGKTKIVLACCLR